MEERDFDILKDRLFHKKSFAEIGEQYGMTRQRCHQLYTTLIEKLIYTSEYDRWKEKNNLTDFNNKLINLMLLLDERDKEKFQRVVYELNIKEPEDFLLRSKKSITMIRGIGSIFLLKLKLALLKYGIPYDSESFESIELKLNCYGESSFYNKLRFKIFLRDNFTCQYCGKSPKNDNNVILHIDHIIPLSKNGSFAESNLITSCKECNIGKGNIVLKDQDSNFEEVQRRVESKLKRGVRRTQGDPV